MLTDPQLANSGCVHFLRTIIRETALTHSITSPLWMRAIALIVASFLFAGCQATVQEKHYFATYPGGDTSRPPTNFFRLTVDAHSHFSNARYLSGFYDERAVDLFFNEMTRTKGDQTLFQQSMSEPGKSAVLTPLDPAEHGTFVLILSTNADTIADTIGAFAENDVVGNAVTQLINRSASQRAVKSDASAGSLIAGASAFTDELKAWLQVASAAPDPASAQIAYLQAVNLVARELGRQEAFRNLDDALIWLQARSSP